MSDTPISPEAREAAHHELRQHDLKRQTSLGYYVQQRINIITKKHVEEMAGIVEALNAAGVPIGTDSELYTMTQRVECLARISTGWMKALDEAREQLRVKDAEIAQLKEISGKYENRYFSENAELSSLKQELERAHDWAKVAENNIVRDRDATVSELRATLSWVIKERDTAQQERLTAIANLNSLHATVETLTVKGEDLCHKYGNALIEIHDLKTSRDSLQRRVETAKRDTFVYENFIYDPTTGVREGCDSGEEWVSDREELIEKL